MKAAIVVILFLVLALACLAALAATPDTESSNIEREYPDFDWGHATPIAPGQRRLIEGVGEW